MPTLPSLCGDCGGNVLPPFKWSLDLGCKGAICDILKPKGGGCLGLLGELFECHVGCGGGDTDDEKEDRPDEEEPDGNTPEEEGPEDDTEDDKPDEEKPDEDTPDEDKPDEDKPDEDKPDENQSSSQSECETKTATHLTAFCNIITEVAGPANGSSATPAPRTICTSTKKQITHGCSVRGTTTSKFDSCSQTQTATDFTKYCTESISGGKTYTPCTKTVSTVFEGCSVTATTTSVIDEACHAMITFAPDDPQGEFGSLPQIDACVAPNITIEELPDDPPETTSSKTTKAVASKNTCAPPERSGLGKCSVVTPKNLPLQTTRVFDAKRLFSCACESQTKGQTIDVSTVCGTPMCPNSVITRTGAGLIFVDEDGNTIETVRGTPSPRFSVAPPNKPPITTDLFVHSESPPEHSYPPITCNCDVPSIPELGACSRRVKPGTANPGANPMAWGGMRDVTVCDCESGSHAGTTVCDQFACPNGPKLETPTPCPSGACAWPTNTSPGQCIPRSAKVFTGGEPDDWRTFSFCMCDHQGSTQVPLLPGCDGAQVCPNQLDLVTDEAAYNAVADVSCTQQLPSLSFWDSCVYTRDPAPQEWCRSGRKTSGILVCVILRIQRGSLTIIGRLLRSVALFFFVIIRRRWSAGLYLMKKWRLRSCYRLVVPRR
jgi:hypothetical protein